MALPDLIEIVPLDKPVRAEITVPGSKSITNRALILAALADGETAYRRALERGHAGDGRGAAETWVFKSKLSRTRRNFATARSRSKDLAEKSRTAARPEKPMELFVGNAGTAARFLAAFVCLGNGVYRLTACRGCTSVRRRRCSRRCASWVIAWIRRMTNCRRQFMAVGVEVTRLKLKMKVRDSSRRLLQRNASEHRGKLAVCLGAVAVRKSRRLESRSRRRERGGIALRGDDRQNDRGVSAARRKIPNRAGCIERELFLGC